ncbi:MAG: sulfurtransferase, partial [Deferribacterales bacterium]|nr:sulfurtransferase [Deferribacterales bacterium]
NIPDTKFDKFYPQLEELKVTKDTELVVYCGGFNCIKSYNDAKYLRDKGFKNIKVYLAGDPDWSQKNFMEISFDYAKSLLSKGVLFVDARPDRVYAKGTIPGAINIPDTKFLKDPAPFMSMLPADKNTQIVVFCGGYACVKSHKVAEKLYEMGYKKVLVYARGEPEWKEKGEQILKPGEKADMVAAKTAAPTASAIKAGADEGTVDKEFFKSLIDSRPDNIVIVDVRSPSEFQAGHVNGAINIPVDDMYKDCNLVTSKLPKDKYVIFMCATGGRAGEMYFGLKEDCKYPEMSRLYFLDAHVDYSSGKCEIK